MVAVGHRPIYLLIGFRNRAVVAMNWAWNDLAFQRGTRLITGLVRRFKGRGARDRECRVE
jgi:hypothetical protein